MSSYAVIASGGRQLRVAPGDLVRVDRLTAAAGEQVTFDKVLMVGGDGGVQVGAPTLSGAKVVGSVVEEIRDRKVMIFKKRRTKTFRKIRGHRQYLTVVRIDSIDLGR